MKFIIRIAGFVLLALVFYQSAEADETGFREIIDIGCEVNSGECYVLLSGEAFGDEHGCPGRQARWNSLETRNGRSVLALLTSAFISGKWATLYIDGCYETPGRGPWPQLGWINIRDIKDVP